MPGGLAWPIGRVRVVSLGKGLPIPEEEAQPTSTEVEMGVGGDLRDRLAAAAHLFRLVRVMWSVMVLTLAVIAVVVIPSPEVVILVPTP